MRLIYERAYFIGNAFSTAAYFRERLIFERAYLRARTVLKLSPPQNCCSNSSSPNLNEISHSVTSNFGSHAIPILITNPSPTSSRMVIYVMGFSNYNSE